MRPLPRTSIASLVCPWTPFLAPRLLHVAGSPAAQCLRRAPLPLGFAAPYSQLRMVKRPVYKKDVHRRPGGEGYASPRDSALMKQFIEALQSRLIPTVMELYPSVIESTPMQPEDTRRIATTLHNYLRNHPHPASQSESVMVFVERLTEDIRLRKLPPHTYAHVHLMGIYKECRKYDEGYAFWQWLQDQDDAYVDQAVYGAAIEMLAYQRHTSLQALEDLYIHGLKRFPGTFAEYHLSPEAIVPDRTQPTTIVGIPMLLLQGILTARMSWRDWKKAYLALDTALRLYPHQTPPRFFELFINERPITEGYTVFLMACRSGVLFKPNHLTRLLSMLNDTMAHFSSVDDRMVVLRGMVNALYAYLQAGGTLEGPHLGSFLNAFGNLLPPKTVGEDYQGNDAQIRNLIATTAHEIMKTLMQAGVPPAPQLFISLIKIAGTLRVPALLEVTLKDVETAQIDIGAIGRRNVLISAGYLKDKSALERTWAGIASQTDLEGRKISYSDWISCARACRRAGHGDFFEEQLQIFNHALTSREHQLMREAMDEREPPSPPNGLTSMAPAEFMSLMEGVRDRIADIATVVMSGQPLDLSKTPFPMFLDPERQALGPTEDLRAVYDDLTTDPHQPSPELTSERPKPVSSTGIPLDELRFLNWCTVMELMSEAEGIEEEYQRRWKDAIAQGRPVEPKHTILTFRKADHEAEPSVYGDVSSREHIRATIKRLRAPKDPRSSQSRTPVRRVVTADTDTSATKPEEPNLDARSEPSLDGSAEEPQFTPLIRSVLSAQPRLIPYFSLQSDHDAPAPDATVVSNRPLRKPARASSAGSKSKRKPS
ncbi:hypothetical protein BCR34DRAFT_491732 [Clohesyomyces aquaticus]|uniref:Uncharacterized protein n=1 Tax=Clohesyomyces aquaticus TaxID=1231657 RepID=A0A1Y1Z1V9_9PLEO|nr:hypothetical protein BCR34DRAFT_491732 [Clohesyomyces aquaticus]